MSDSDASRPAALARRAPARANRPGPPSERCVRMTVAVPTDWPVASRRHVAVARLQVVDRRGDAVLVCDGLHGGPHFWPEDEPSSPIWDADLDASLDAPPADEAEIGPELAPEVEQESEAPRES